MKTKEFIKQNWWVILIFLAGALFLIKLLAIAGIPGTFTRFGDISFSADYSKASLTGGYNIYYYSDNCLGGLCTLDFSVSGTDYYSNGFYEDKFQSPFYTGIEKINLKKLGIPENVYYETPPCGAACTAGFVGVFVKNIGTALTPTMTGAQLSILESAYGITGWEYKLQHFWCASCGPTGNIIDRDDACSMQVQIGSFIIGFERFLKDYPNATCRVSVFDKRSNSLSTYYGKAIFERGSSNYLQMSSCGGNYQTGNFLLTCKLDKPIKISWYLSDVPGWCKTESPVEGGWYAPSTWDCIGQGKASFEEVLSVKNVEFEMTPKLCPNGKYAFRDEACPECKEGETKCVGAIHYACENQKWKYEGIVKGECGVTCEERQIKCEDNKAMECFNGMWILKEVCGYKCEEGKCIPKPFPVWIFLIPIVAVVVFLVYKLIKKKR